MKKILFSMFIFCILIIAQGCASSNGRVAIYVRSNAITITEEQRNALNSRIVDGFVNSGKYEVVERDYGFLKEIQKEHEKQRSGAVDDKQISELGKQFGVEFVCVTDVVEVYNTKHISARLIDVETAVIVAVGNTESTLDSIGKFKEASDKIVNSILKASVISKKKKAENTESVTNKTEDKLEAKTEDKTSEDKVTNTPIDKSREEIRERQYYNQYNRQPTYDDDDW